MAIKMILKEFQYDEVELVINFIGSLRIKYWISYFNWWDMENSIESLF